MAAPESAPVLASDPLGAVDDGVTTVGVAVSVAVAIGVGVAVSVGVAVAVSVAVADGVAVGVDCTRMATATWSQESSTVVVPT